MTGSYHDLNIMVLETSKDTYNKFPDGRQAIKRNKKLFGYTPLLQLWRQMCVSVLPQFVEEKD